MSVHETEKWGRIEELAAGECMILAFVLGPDTDPSAPKHTTLHIRFPEFAVDIFRTAPSMAKLELLRSLDKGMEDFKRRIVAGA